MVSIILSRITDDDDQPGSQLYTYTIKNFQSLTIDVRTPISPLPLPEESASENVLVKMEGNTKTISLSWTIHDSSVDLGGGVKRTAETIIKTVQQQLKYLSNTMQGTSLQHRFQLKIKYSDVGGEDMDFYGFINEITFTSGDTTPITFQANLSFIEGKVVTTIDGDVPSAPTNVQVTTPPPGGGAGRLTVTWTAPSYTAGSIDSYDLEFIDTTNFYIYYKKFGHTASPITTAVNSLNPGSRYSVRVRGKNINGEGKWSSWEPVFDEESGTADGEPSSLT